ncbi:MAG TPA: hypothetical protein VMZ03_14390 [Chitinophagaceae bacterium]|nr:hypothetical protein [Chitinophagaceae bacterium]
MRNGLFILSLFFLPLLMGCGDYPCAKASLNYRLIGFSDAESDTIILRRLSKNSVIIKDSFVFDPSNGIAFERFGDTLVMVAYPGNALMESDHDYQLFFPGAARTIHVTEIIEKLSYGKNPGPFNSKKNGCLNEITSCKVDGQPGIFFFANGIYLRK